MTEAIRRGDVPGVQIRLRRLFPAAVDALWGWLTDPRRMSAWLGTVTAKSAEALVIECDGGEDGRLRERWEIVGRERPAAWSLRLRNLERDWPVATPLDFHLHPREEGGELSLFQQGFAHLPLSTCLTEWELYRRRWRAAYGRLAEALAAEAESP